MVGEVGNGGAGFTQIGEVVRRAEAGLVMYGGGGDRRSCAIMRRSIFFGVGDMARSGGWLRTVAAFSVAPAGAFETSSHDHHINGSRESLKR